MRGPRITIPWYRRQIFSSPTEIELVTPLDSSNFRRPKSNPNNPNPETQPEMEPNPVSVPNPSPNPSTNPSTNPDGSPDTKLYPLQYPNGFPQFPSNQPFPIPQTPVITPRTKPAAKPKKEPGRSIPFPKRNPGRSPAKVPAAASDILQPWPTHQPQAWELIPVGGLTPLENNTSDLNPWFNPVIGYANEIGAFGDNAANESAIFINYLKEYNYADFSVTGMYNDLSGMYGAGVAVLLMAYIIASIPLGIPGVPGI
jgi:hypothetical protein